MVREVSAQDFVRSPVGSYVADATWLCFCPDDASVIATVLWSHLDEEQLHALCDVVPETHCPSLAPHGYLLDVRGVEGLDPWLFPNLDAYLKENHEVFARAVTSLAIVRPEGLLAATVAEGFFDVMPAPCPVRVFIDPEAALEWLGRAHVAADLAQAVAVVRATSRLSTQLRELLGRVGPGVPIHEIAGELGVSSRTLQRRLQDEGTSFRGEVNTARLRAAQRLLSGSEASITEIAFEVGYASPAHLAEQFRRRMGETPTQWREKRRGATA
jgi:AraC-like DNA-binding protein